MRRASLRLGSELRNAFDPEGCNLVNADALNLMPQPASATLLGWTMVGVDPVTGEVTIAFDGKREFCNPTGFVQGGMLIAMMDDTMGPATFIHSNATKMISSIDIHAQFLRPVTVGAITVTARVVRMGRRVAFIEAELFDASGKLCARASSSAHVADFLAPSAAPG